MLLACTTHWLSKQAVYYHFPNSVTLRFSEQAKIFTQIVIEFQNQWNLHIKQKANQYTDQSYSECVWCVFLPDFTKHVDSKIAPKTQAIVFIDMLFYMKNTCMSHCTFKSNFYALSSWLKCLFCLLQNRARPTPNAIGHCIV